MADSHPPYNIEKLEVYNQLISILIESDANAPSIDQNYIRVHSVEGQEGVSQPYQFTVELRADDTEEAGVLLDSTYIGHWARIKVATPKESDFGPRFFRGIITELAVAEAGVYTLTVQSPLQLLTLRNDYFIYTHCDLRQLIQQILAPELQDPRFTLRFDFSDSPTLTRIQDWMQAGESSMDMLQRVLGKAFINFYFIHYPDKLILVFSDKPTTPETVAIPGYENGPLPLRYTFSSVEPLRAQQYDVFANLRYSIKMMPAKVNTLLNQVDPQWKDNTVANFQSYRAQSNDASQLGFQHHWNYDYGSNTDEAKSHATKIRQQIATEEGTLSGAVYTPMLSPGYCFQLTNPLLDVKTVEGKGRPDFNEKIYVVTSLQHKISSETGYNGSIQATEVNITENEQQQTYLTPFSMHSTQQGSVLARVLDHQMPVGWRYRAKNNFQPEKGQVFFEGGMEFQGECYGEAGCLVELATGQRHWVVLPRSSQSVPEVNSMVMIGRGSNESEQPELQQVLASHGSKVIQPPDRRNASWQANTNWGSSYSTSYGDSISIHYGHNAQTDLKRAIRLVEGAYDNVGMAGTYYGSCSYNKGGSWSVSISGNQSSPDVGVLSASISQGSSFNESHAAHSYSYGSTNISEGYSETGKSANVSVIGEYVSSPDYDSPSFVNGKIPKDISEYTNALSTGDTFSRTSILGRSINCTGVGTTAPDVSVGAVPPLTHYNNTFTLGISDNISKTIGATFNDSLMVGLSFSNSIMCAAQISNSLTIGPTMSMDTRIGPVKSLSTTIGKHTSASFQISDTKSFALTVGKSDNTQFNISDNKNTSMTVGKSNDSSLYVGNKKSQQLFIGDTDDTSINISDRKSSSVMIGDSEDKSVNISDKKSTSIFLGSMSDTNINLSDRSATNISIGTSDDLTLSLAASNSTSITMAAKMDLSLSLAASMSLSLSMGASVAIENSLSASAVMKNSISASVELINTLAATAKIVNQASVDFEMVNGVTKAEMDMRQKAELHATIAEILSLEAKV